MFRLPFGKWQPAAHLAFAALCISLAFVAVYVLVPVLWTSAGQNQDQELVSPIKQIFPDTQRAAILPDLPTPEPKPVTLMFVGDMMFDRHIRTKARQNGGYSYILEPMAPLFNSADLIIGNLEGPVTTNPSRSEGSVPGSTDNYFFTFDPVILEELKKFPFVVNLGNNHITNFGSDGIDQTLDFLAGAQIPFFGQIGRAATTPESVIIPVRNLKVALINYNEFLPGGMERALADIQKLKPQSDLVVVYPHWGAEYVPVANQVIADQARAFADAGADLVIGSHPHVIQNQETYNGVPIYYSLGNFVFDQYFSPEVMKGLVVTAVIDPDSKEITTQEQFVNIDKSGAVVPVENTVEDQSEN